MQRRPIKMQCDVSGVPPPEVTWTKDGVEVSEGRPHLLSQGGQVLQLTAAVVEDAGDYVCTAQNIAGIDRRQFRLQVLGTPANIIYVKKTFQFRTQRKGVKSYIRNCTDHFGEDTSSNCSCIPIGAPGGRKSPFFIDLRYRPYLQQCSLRTNVFRLRNDL